MLRLVVSRPREVTTARTQSYRLLIRAELVAEGVEASSSSSLDDLQQLVALDHPQIFITSLDDNGITQFERVAEPIELQELGVGYQRTDQLDLWLPAGRELADELLRALVADVQALLSSLALREVRVSLDAAGV